MSEKIVLGIDLGTTYSAMAYIDETEFPKIIENDIGCRTTPSVVFFENTENGVHAVVGKEAKNSIVVDPTNGVELAKREIANLSLGTKRTWSIFDKEYTPEEISSFILRKLKTDASAKLGQDITDVVITVPAYFDASAREATRNAGLLAGLNVIAIFNEPEASALLYSYQRAKKPETLFVYDLGGGTFDVTVVKYDDKGKCDVVATDGDHQLGGADFDNIILAQIEQKSLQDGININEDLALSQDVKNKIEEAKWALSSKESTKLRVKNKFYEIHRKDYDQWIERKLDETEAIMIRVMEAAKKKDPTISDWSAIDRVLLIGGATKTPAVKARVAKITGKSEGKGIDMSQNPDEAVALGAAIYAKIYKDIVNKTNEEEKKGTLTPEKAAEKKIRLIQEKVSSVCSHSIGVLAINENGKLENTVLVHKNTTLPAQENYDFGTSSSNQRTAQIRIVLGDDKEPERCKEIGEAVLKLSGKNPIYSPIRVTIKYSIDGRIDVSGEDLVDGNKVQATLEIANQMNPEEIQKGRQELCSVPVQ